MPDIEVWRQFDHDPRNPVNAGMRASDRDRAVIESVLADAFAEGRITRAEYDERAEAALTSRVLGDLVHLVKDLPVSRAPRTSDEDLQRQALRRWQGQRREALLGFVGLSALLWTIWAITMFGDFPWPLFPTGFALMNLLRIVARKDDIVDDHVRELEKKERKAIERQSIRKHVDGI
ncbi:protein of unknown function [Nocardioides exalbidus]|uniref:DUF1707 domain-containing protein n=1 Tax=Nocardioides exalbidus TaxID=402596 RepID=A0A1H4Z5K3_9ACTN|nr:DUF1707 domain-containing protein [Nocardioides exalbidus]SED25433.1 protein of unknown function [Nocardioides exalbidus]